MARDRGKKNKEIKRIQDRVYEHMLHVAQSLTEDPDIIEMYCVLHTGEDNYGLKFISETTYTDTEVKRIYTMYGCDEEGRAFSKRPLFVGNFDETISYLENKSNLEKVMQAVVPKRKEC